jgi:hypothetical protein
VSFSPLLIDGISLKALVVSICIESRPVCARWSSLDNSSTSANAWLSYSYVSASRDSSSAMWSLTFLRWRRWLLLLD